jgi:hypothetical protein
MRERATAGRPQRAIAALALAFAVAFAPSLAAPARAQEAASATEAQLEAAFLVNFVRYTDWPEERALAPGAPYVITVVGDAAVARNLLRLAAVVAPVRGRRIEVQQLEFPEGADATVRASISDRLRRSHLVFVHETREPLEAILGELSGQPVLTVSDREGFARAGGMLGLERRGGRIVFEANPAAIRNARLVVSAKVLKLATIVEGAVR